MYVIIIKKEEINDMKKFISSILILGFTVMPMSYVVFAQEGTAIVSEVQTENEAIKEGMFTKGQTALATQDDNNIGKQSEDLKEYEDTQAYTKEFQYATMQEETQQDTQEKNFQDVQNYVQINENSESFLISPEIKNNLKKVSVMLPLFVAKKCVRLLFNYLSKRRPDYLKDRFNVCKKLYTDLCWKGKNSDIDAENLLTEYNKCEELAQSTYCANKYKSMKNAEKLGFAVKIVDFLFDVYKIVNSKNF